MLSLGQEPAAGTTHPHILVVDDEPAIRTYLCECLTGHAAYRCSGASGPRDAMNLARAGAVDVAVLAHTMSADGGFNLARLLRDELPDVPVVLITGTQSFDAAVEAMRIGIFDYLLAPFAMPELFDTVARAAAWRADALGARRSSSAVHRQIAEKSSRLSQTFMTDGATPRGSMSCSTG
jgi:DNA-binding NtrC family response regulator